MTSLLDRTPTPERSANGHGQYRLPVRARERRPLVTVACALLVLASIAIFASVYSSADHRVPVLVVTSTIRQGQRITGGHLGTVEVAASGGLSVIPVASASELSGTWAAVTIPAGSLISLHDVTSSRPLASGSAVVGLALKDGQLPADGVEPGDQVMVVQTPAIGSVLTVGGTTDGSDTGTGDGSGDGSDSGADSGSGSGPTSDSGVLVAQATVFEASAPPASSASDSAELVSVEVPATEAAAVASASSASQVSLVLLPDAGDPSSGGSSAASGSR